MVAQPGGGNDKSAAGNETQAQQVPSISLPKGGGAIRGIGEKFAANPVTGTGSLSVPLATSPGRSGFGPQLALAYDSGAGNGPFGLGWNLGLPSITRKTDKGLPRYFDAEESDVYILSGAEDLVPEFEKDDAGDWVLKDGKHVIHDKPRTVNGITYQVRRYRPRTEGLFARIERWTRQSDGDIHWRSISRDNITTLYGRTAESQDGQPSENRLVDPADPRRVFSWLICESYDDKGNAMLYRYEAENDQGVGVAEPQERNRLSKPLAQRYLKRIQYGNHTPRQPDEDLTQRSNWLFEVVFDYGEHDETTPTPDPMGTDWPVRPDPFSSYRAGFEVRTYRRCQRVLMFHNFSELGSTPCLVRSTEFDYRDLDYTSEVNARTELAHQGSTRIASFIQAVTQVGWLRQNGSYLKKTLPPLEFEYSQPIIQDDLRELDDDSLENLPNGLDGSVYQWVDLDGEGVTGILTEQADGWFYKRNLSPVNFVGPSGSPHLEARFAPAERVATLPNARLATGQAQFLDLAGDGQTDVVMLRGATPGFYERTEDEDWEPFRTFDSLPNIPWNDPNLRFVDLNGDGHADVLITEQDVFTWYPSLAEDGFGPAERERQSLDEERGPRLVFADGAQSVYLADMSGDGLSDFLRVGNGEIAYWPNLGYGRFGAKVTMDNAPWFDFPDQFDHQRVRLADIDGSGSSDLIYLGRDGVRLYFNRSGNSWSEPRYLPFPAVDNLASVTAVDLLGNGTACLVWSSPLPGNARRPLRYVDLMGGQKPHLLLKSVNNLGAETRVHYAPSTQFYLADKLAGRPWITRLPFPVHVVEEVTVTDKWRKTSFSSTYSYHHGYFDGTEREFRGFGRVEQVDVESYDKFEQGNSDSPYITDDKTLYQPPVKTVTWYHTGAFLDRERILSQFEDEYFPNWLKHKHPLPEITWKENPLPQPDLSSQELSETEWREGLRACKGMMLRQEVYELDVDALEHPEHPRQVLVKLFSTAYHNCHIRRLQPQAENLHAVFLVAESEAITYHYELDIREEHLLDLQPDPLKPDPRIAHTLNLRLDEHANVLQSVAVVYPRREQFEDATLEANDLALIRGVQNERHLTYTETRYTEDFGLKQEDQNAALDNHRLRLPCEVLTYELTGIRPELEPYFTLDELRAFQLSEVHQVTGEVVESLSYHEIADKETKKEKRLIEHVRTLFFQENLAAALPLGEHGRLGLPYESYKLALTDALLEPIFKRDDETDRLDDAVGDAFTARAKLDDPKVSGYLSGADLIARFKTVPVNELTDQYWIRSGIAGFAEDAAQHFYLPERFTDPFGNVTTLEYDGKYDLFITSSTDAMGNVTRVTKTEDNYNFDYRVLAPREMQDMNDNLSEVYFDVLGLPTAMVVKGKGTEGDNLTDFTTALANPELTELNAFFVENPYNENQARIWLGNATARHVYYFGETIEGDKIIWGTHPACACGILREQHVSQLAPGETSPLQTSFEYSDGMGSVIVKKVQAEPETQEQPMRWVASGKTILNNKGKPVKQYEPYFCPPEVGHRFEDPPEVGVTSIIYYDAVGRTVRTEMPDGSFSRVEFSPWHVHTFDQNDTVTETGNDWFARRSAGSTEEKRSAQLAAEHANTPALIILDSLGRDVISVAHNRVKNDAGEIMDEKYLTFTKLDAEGKPLWIRDARKNLVMQYIRPSVPNNQATDPVEGFVPCYDIAGNLLFQHSMDACDRWTLNDAAGKPMFAWDSRGHMFRTDYDALHRPVSSFIKGANPDDANRVIQFEKIIYGDTPGNGLTDKQKIQLNEGCARFT